MPGDANQRTEKERIPYILGYQKTPKNADDFNAIFERVLAVPVDP